MKMSGEEDLYDFSDVHFEDIVLNVENSVNTDEEEWVPPTPPPYDVAERLRTANLELRADTSSELHVANRIRWKPDDCLVEIRFFHKESKNDTMAFLRDLLHLNIHEDQIGESNTEAEWSEEVDDKEDSKKKEGENNLEKKMDKDEFGDHFNKEFLAKADLSVKEVELNQDSNIKDMNKNRDNLEIEESKESIIIKSNSLQSIPNALSENTSTTAAVSSSTSRSRSTSRPRATRTSRLRSSLSLTDFSENNKERNASSDNCRPTSATNKLTSNNKRSASINNRPSSSTNRPITRKLSLNSTNINRPASVGLMPSNNRSLSRLSVNDRVLLRKTSSNSLSSNSSLSSGSESSELMSERKDAFAKWRMRKREERLIRQRTAIIKAKSSQEKTLN